MECDIFSQTAKGQIIAVLKVISYELYKCLFVRDTNIFFQLTCMRIWLCLFKTHFLPKSPHSKAFPFALCQQEDAQWNEDLRL